MAGVAVLVLALFASSVDADPRGGATTQVPAFHHVIVVVFENHSARSVLDYPGSPFRRLGRQYSLLTRYDAVAHPSLPNYLALVSGSTHGAHHDCTQCVIGGRSLADTVAARSLTWRMYVEQLDLYRDRGLRISGPEKARLPFLYFRDLLASDVARRSTVSLERFYDDLRAGRLPSFSLVIPDLCHDMHSCSIAKGDLFMRSFLRILRPGLLKGTAVFVVFDEARRTDRRGGGGRVPAIVAGPLVKPHSVSARPLTHYSLLRTIEDAWGLPRLGRSAFARPITGIWHHP